MVEQTVVVAGGTGLVGTALTTQLVQSGYRVIILTRNPQAKKPRPEWGGMVSYAGWDPSIQVMDREAIAQANAIVNLAGSGVMAKPWTKGYKKEIHDSRVNSSKLLLRAIGENGHKLETVVNASAIGWYGSDSSNHPSPFTEDDLAAPGFLGETCFEWEASIQPVTSLGKRLVICRLGLVLSKEGGVLAEIEKPLAFRAAVILGSGQQVMSWIHIQDLCRVILFAIENKDMQGVFNAVAPHPVTNRFLTLALARHLYGRAFISLKVPACFLRLAMGERFVEVLKSATVSSSRLGDAGFRFKFPDIGKALSSFYQTD